MVDGPLIVGRWYSLAAYGPMQLEVLPDPPSEHESTVHPALRLRKPGEPRQKVTYTFRMPLGERYYASRDQVVCELDRTRMENWIAEHERVGAQDVAAALRTALENWSGI
jgi:hypothetical protein